MSKEKPKLQVDGKDYIVAKDLGFSHSRGCFGKFIWVAKQKRLVVSPLDSKYWRFSSAIKYRQQIEPRPVVITGCPRSGTTYITEVLNKLGVDVLHEQWGPDGTVGWHYTDDAYEQWGKDDTLEWRRADNHEATLLVRDPINCISSIQTIKAISFEYARDRIMRYFSAITDETFPAKKVHPVRYGVIIYYFWNRMRQDHCVNPLIRVESPVRSLFQLLNRKGWGFSLESIAKAARSVRTNTNTRRHTMFTREQILEAAGEFNEYLPQELCRMASLDFGYTSLKGE